MTYVPPSLEGAVAYVCRVGGVGQNMWPYLAGAAPPVIVDKSALFASRCPFSLERNVPFHHQQGALLNLGLPPSNCRLRTAMTC